MKTYPDIVKKLLKVGKDGLSYPSSLFDNSTEYLYVRDNKVRDVLSNVFNADLKVVYRMDCTRPEVILKNRDGIDLSMETFYIVLPDGRVTTITTSEWGYAQVYT